MADWRIEAYRLDTGETPAQTFLDSLDGEPRADALALLKLLREYGHALRLPHSRALGNGLFELRGFRSACSMCSGACGRPSCSTG